MGAAPLSWLAKIGGDTLKTKAKLLSSAINELHDDGQCKIVAVVDNTADNGKTVLITTDDNKTYSGTVNKKCEFLLPPKTLYTVQKVSSGTAEFTTKVEAGYGDCILVHLDTGYVAVKQGDIVGLDYIKAATADDLKNKVPEANAVKELNSSLTNNLIFNNAGYHNSIFRGKNLGSAVTDAQYTAISSGTFEDLYIGDYWVINGVTWRIAHFDYWMNCGDTATTKHHIVVVPDTNLYTAAMNSSNVTTGGYAGSAMRSSVLADALSTAKTAFNNHVLSVRRYFTNAVTNGRPSAGAWFDSECDLMSEAMVYGNYVFSPTSDGTNVPKNYNVDYKQLALFVLAPQFICIRAWYWLLNVVSSASFARVTAYGSADYGAADNGSGVRPAIAITGNQI